MKKIECVIIVAVILLISVCFTSNAVVTQKAKDLRDFLLQPPNKIWQEYGYSEDNLRLYNIARLIELNGVFAKRITTLEGKVSILEKQAIVVPDPNEVAK